VPFMARSLHIPLLLAPVVNAGFDLCELFHPALGICARAIIYNEGAAKASWMQTLLGGALYPQSIHYYSEFASEPGEA